MTKKKNLKILVLFEVNEPPAADEEYERLMKEQEDWFTEGHVVATLRENEHVVHFGAIEKHPRELIDLVERVAPDLVWNRRSPSAATATSRATSSASSSCSGSPTPAAATAA
jgi:hypothetical protein